jgi:hypothetical protein
LWALLVLTLEIFGAPKHWSSSESQPNNSKQIIFLENILLKIFLLGKCIMLKQMELLIAINCIMIQLLEHVWLMCSFLKPHF